MKSIVSAAVIILIAGGCYVAKPLDREVHVSINTNFPVVIQNTGRSTYSAKYSEDDYRKSYIHDMEQEFLNDHIVIDNAAPEFVVVINSLELHESTRMDTIKNVKSAENGNIHEITLAGLKTSGTIAKAGSTAVVKWTADKDKNEELTNSTNIEQAVKGENKDNTVYREKAFDENEFVVQSGHCGRRAAVRIAQEIKKQLGK